MSPRSSKSICVAGNRLYRGGRFVAGWFQVEDGKIARWGSEAESPPPGIPSVDAFGQLVVPGLIDHHVHGLGGIDAAESGASKLSQLAEKMAASGTTSFLATLYPASPKSLEVQLRAVREAGLLGAHLEGPFVNPAKAGALDPKFFLGPNRKDADRLIRAGRGVLRKITLAPELPGALDLIPRFREQGIAVSMGHSEASFEEARAGAAAGARSVTHLFNAMRPFHHREPGLAGYALIDPEVSCELIGDLRHVAPGALELVFQQKQSVVLISDCLKGAGPGKKTFHAGGAQHEIRGGASYLAGTKTLSGSCSTLFEIVRGLVKKNLLSVERAVFLASTFPAMELGIAGKKGDLASGCDADFLILDSGLSLRKVYRAGQLVKTPPPRSR